MSHGAILHTVHKNGCNIYFCTVFQLLTITLDTWPNYFGLQRLFLVLRSSWWRNETTPGGIESNKIRFTKSAERKKCISLFSCHNSSVPTIHDLQRRETIKMMARARFVPSLHTRINLSHFDTWGQSCMIACASQGGSILEKLCEVSGGSSTGCHSTDEEPSVWRVCSLHHFKRNIYLCQTVQWPFYKIIPTSSKTLKSWEIDWTASVPGNLWYLVYVIVTVGMVESYINLGRDRDKVRDHAYRQSMSVSFYW